MILHIFLEYAAIFSWKCLVILHCVDRCKDGKGECCRKMNYIIPFPISFL